MHTDTLGLYAPTTATYQTLKTMAEVANEMASSGEGSRLAAALLLLPDALTETTASVIFDSARFDGGVVPQDPHPTQDDIVDLYEKLADQAADEAKLDPVDTSVLEQVLSFADLDVEAARAFYQSTEEERRSTQRPLRRIEKVRLLMAELSDQSGELTMGQVLLAEDPETADVAARAFPKAGALMEELCQETLTPAEVRRQELRAQAARYQEATAGTLAYGEAHDLDIAILLGEDPQMVASIALSLPNLPTARVIEALQAAPDEQIFDWLFGLSPNLPQPGAVKELVEGWTEERVQQLASFCKERMDSLEAEGHDFPAPAWIVDIIEHIYVPNIALDPQSAALVWHRFSEACGDDPSLWLATVTAANADEPTRLSDIV